MSASRIIAGVSNVAGRMNVGMVAAGLLIGLSAANARAAAQAVYAVQNPNLVSNFTLDFGESGGLSSAEITSTQLGLLLDSSAGTARLVSYYQHVDPLLLFGAYNTGPITVQAGPVVDPTHPTGTYDAATGAFTTAVQYYIITFTEDLSAIGFQSPVYLPGSASGQISGTGAGSALHMGWNGEVQFPNGATLRYVCAMEALVQQLTPGDLNCDGSVNQFDITPFVNALSDPMGFAGSSSSCSVSNADVNADGSINQFDIQTFVDLLNN